MILIVGASGYIGAALLRYFRARQQDVIGTFCTRPAAGLVHLDLKHPDLQSLNLDWKNLRYCILCSAATNIDACKADEAHARAVNVAGIQTLIEQLFAANVVPVFLSSDHVFDGSKGDYRELDDRRPVNVYGQTKKAVEDYLMACGREYLVARLSKVYGTEPRDKTLFTAWISQLKNRETIRCAHDQTVSPTYVLDIPRVLEIAFARGLRGVYNLSGGEAFSRYALATIVQSTLALPGTIESCSIDDFGLRDARPHNTSLNGDQVRAATGFAFTTVRESIDRLAEAYACNPERF